MLRIRKVRRVWPQPFFFGGKCNVGSVAPYRALKVSHFSSFGGKCNVGSVAPYRALKVSHNL